MKAVSVLIVLGLVAITTAAPTSSKTHKKDLGTVIAIDLGTKYSRVGVYKDGHVKIIADDEGNSIIPSYVAFTADSQHLIGDAAKNQVITNPENTVFDVKRIIGREWSDETVQRDVHFFPFKVINENKKPYIEINTSTGKKIFSPEEISAIVLGKLKKMSEAYLGKTVTHAVISVPAYFNNIQRQATIDAAKIAGLNVSRIINEPTAAALAYGFHEQEKKNIILFKLGGGSFDVSLLESNNKLFEIQATSGNTHLGGETFNQRILDYFIEIYKKKKGKDIRKDVKAFQKLCIEVEKAKIILSEKDEVKIEIKDFYKGASFEETLTRAKFEELNMDLFQITLKTVQNVLEDFSNKDIDEIMLVGGSTNIPKVQQLLKEYFRGKKFSQITNPDEIVVYGTAIQAGLINDEKGTEDVTIIDLNPLAISITVLDRLIIPVVPKNTVIPSKRSLTIAIEHTNRLKNIIQIFEGNSPRSEENLLLSKFEFNDMSHALVEMPKIEVTIQIDANGIVCKTHADLFKIKKPRAFRKGSMILQHKPIVFS